MCGYVQQRALNSYFANIICTVANKIWIRQQVTCMWVFGSMLGEIDYTFWNYLY